MNTNSIFQIGHDHYVCEDYSLTGIIGDIAYAIVCDGCSSSRDVDFGARAMAMSAKRMLRPNELTDELLTSEKFGTAVIQNANRCFDVFPHLHPYALDATLLVAMVKNKKLTAYMYGDGVLIHKTKAGLHTVHIHLTSGAPDYLSYQLDPLRNQAYAAIKDNKKEVSVTICGETTEVNIKPLTPYVLNADVADEDVVVVISDGINSFRKADNTPIPWTDLIDEFTGYKTFEGEFVLRRIAAFKRKCLKEGITHSDDISVASIYV